MAPTILDKLPAWSRTIDPGKKPIYGEFIPIATAFLALPADARRDLIKKYHGQYCFPKLDLERASAIYLFFRIIFNLPSQQPLEHVKVFGGWLHPSINTGQPYFNLSWPVSMDVDNSTLAIDRFTGYFGKGYNALGEYEYLVSMFDFREPSELGKLVVHQ
ncbi:MAG: hypothetical protein V9G63_03205 [Candidatus Competibacter sp.]